MANKPEAEKGTNVDIYNGATDSVNRSIVDRVQKEDAEADAMLAAAYGKTPEPVNSEGDENIGKNKNEDAVQEKQDNAGNEADVKDTKIEVENENKDIEDLTKDLTITNAQKRISAAQRKMYEQIEQAKKTTAEAEKLKAENEALKALIEQKASEFDMDDKDDKPQKDETKDKIVDKDEIEASLDALRAEYPEIAEPMIKLLHAQREENKKLAEKFSALESKEMAREKTAAMSVEQAHWNKISDAHKDYDEISNDPLFDEWMDSLPTMEKLGAKAIRDSGSADEVIELLTSFKIANGYQSPPTANNAANGDSRLNKAKQLATPSFGKAKSVNAQVNGIRFTREQIRKMSDAEYRRNEPEIEAALSKGLIA